MGEVDKARDTRLDRDVAIKVSNAQFTERFTREARSVAALNYTNIGHLYDGRTRLADRRSDVCVSCYEMLSGKLLFQANRTWLQPSNTS
jgi:serine/threonine protein kinase